MTSYVDYLKSIAPAWLLGPYGEAFLGVAGALKDAVVTSTIAAVKARMPGIAPLDALAHIAAERGIDRGYSETDDTYRLRLANAWNAWTWAGTKKGVLDALTVAGFNASIYENWEWYTTDGNAAAWWRFWIVLKPPQPFAAPTWTIGDGKRIGGAGVVVGSVGLANAAALICRIARKWKPAHAMLQQMLFVFSGAVIGTGWSIGDGTRLGGQWAVATC